MKRAFVFLTTEGDSSNYKMNCTINYGDNILYVYGVNSLEQGYDLCKYLAIHKKCTLIELCGAFKEKGAKCISEILGFNSEIVIAYTLYSNLAEERLAILDGAKNVISTFLLKVNENDEIFADTDFNHGNEILRIICAGSKDEAINKSKMAVKEGCILIEVDHEFGYDTAEAIMKNINNIPIGYTMIYNN